MYDYGYTTTYYNDSLSSAPETGLGVFGIIFLILFVFMIICLWKTYKKAGKKGWTSIVPIYSYIVMIEIAELPMWYFALFFVPFANIYAMFKIYIEVAHKFGKSTAFGLGLIFLSPIFLPILAFGSSKYKDNISNNNNLQSTSNTFSFEQPAQNQSFSSEQPIEQFNNSSNQNIMNFNSESNSINNFNSTATNVNNAFVPSGNLDNNIANNQNNNNQNNN